MALYDLSTEIDYVLQATGNRRLIHSFTTHPYQQVLRGSLTLDILKVVVNCRVNVFTEAIIGTTMAFAGFGLNQSLADKVKVFVALAPVAFLSHIKNPLFAFLAQFDVESLLKILGINNSIVQLYCLTSSLRN